MNKISYKIETFWDEEVEVWVATSDDIFGLATEASSLENLTEKLRVMIPELLIINQQIPEGYQGEISLEIISQELLRGWKPCASSLLSLSNSKQRANPPYK